MSKVKHQNFTSGRAVLFHDTIVWKVQFDFARSSRIGSVSVKALTIWNIIMQTKEKIDLKEQFEQSDRLLGETRVFLLTHGVTLDLITKWVAIEEYCKRFGITNTQTVINWIRRGIIPEEDVHIIPEFDSTCMIRAKKYQSE